MKQSEHLSNDLLIRALDDELSSDARASVQEHLAHCENCSLRYAKFGVVSDQINHLVGSVPVAIAAHGRDTLEKALRQRVGRVANRTFASRLGLGMAIAASLVLGVVFLPRIEKPVRTMSAIAGSRDSQQATLEVDDETFYRLRYSNADLPVTSAHVVRMRVPVSSLADEGLLFQPVSDAAQNPDRAVLADVLVGVDGEPLGIRLVESE